MREESYTVRADVSAGTLWDYLADYDKVIRLGWLDASAHRIAASSSCEVRYNARAVWEGIPSTYTACLEDAERPSTLAWSTSSGGARSRVRFELKPAGLGQTDVTVTLTLKHNAALRALEPFAWGLLRPAVLRTVEAIGSLDERM